MRKNFKKRVQFLFLFTVLFIVSCSKDNYEGLVSQENNAMKVVLLDSKTIKKEKTLFSTISKLNKNLSRLNSQEKNITSGVYNFSIDADYCKMITLDSVTSYTFNVIREPNNGDFENLVIKRLPNDELIAKLYKYIVTPEEKHNILHGIDVDMTNKILVTDINDTEFTGNIFGKAYYSGSLCYQAEMVMTSGTSCKGDDHHAYGDLSCPFINSPYMQAQAPTLSVVYVPVDCGGGAGGTYYGPAVGQQPYPNYPPGILETGVITSPVPTISFEESMFKLFKKNLTDAQYDWLIGQNENIEASILSYLSINDFDVNSTGFITDLINLLINESNLDTNALQFLLNAQIFNSTNNFELNESFFQNNVSLLSPEVQNAAATDPTLLINMGIEYIIQRAVIKHNHPDWSEVEIAWQISKDFVHLGLDIFGLIPVYGEVADLINGTLYTIEGDGLNATLSFASAVPLVGWMSASTKLGIKIITTSTGKTKLVWKLVGNVIQFGDRGQLRKVLGLMPGNLAQAHHIIPWNKQSKSIVQKAAKSGNAFHMNDALNGIPLNSAAHNGSHANYDSVIQVKFDQFNASNPNASPDECYDFLTDLIQDVRNWISSHPNTSINNIVLP